jgi:uncharacterized surface protein with fasciclin (FAS1) repeats
MTTTEESMKHVRLGMTALMVAFVAGCADAAAPVDEPQFNRGGQGQPTIAEQVVAANTETGEFSILLAALGAAGLVDVFFQPGPKTVFAPTDAAFGALPPGTVEGLLADIPALQNILLYHVTSGRREATSVLPATRIRMLNGGFTTISGASINNAAIIGPNAVIASNGIVHVIDAVLLP